MNWNDKPSVKKGAIGEDIVDQWLLKRGFIPYRPIADCAHPFDRLVASKNKSTIVIVEVKSKPRRNLYPDTGIDIRHYDDYSLVFEKYKIPIFLAFVDEKSQSIYGQFLSELNKPSVVEGHEYPWRWDRIIYFPLEAMRTIAPLTQGQTASLAALRNSQHDKALAVASAVNGEASTYPLFNQIYGAKK